MEEGAHCERALTLQSHSEHRNLPRYECGLLRRVEVAVAVARHEQHFLEMEARVVVSLMEVKGVPRKLREHLHE